MKGLDLRHLTQQQEVYLAAAVVLVIIAVVVAIVLLRRWRGGGKRAAVPTADERPIDLSSRLGKLIDGINPTQSTAGGQAEDAGRATVEARGAAFSAPPGAEPAIETALLGAPGTSSPGAGGHLLATESPAAASPAGEWTSSPLPIFADPARGTAPLGPEASFGEPAHGTSPLGAMTDFSEPSLGTGALEAAPDVGAPALSTGPLGAMTDFGDATFDTAPLGVTGGLVAPASGAGRGDEAATLNGARAFDYRSFQQMWQPLYTGDHRLLGAGGAAPSSLLADRRSVDTGDNWSAPAVPAPAGASDNAWGEVASGYAASAATAQPAPAETQPDAAREDNSGWGAAAPTTADGWDSLPSMPPEQPSLATTPLTRSTGSLHIVTPDGEPGAGEQDAEREQGGASDWTHRLSLLGQVEEKWSAPVEKAEQRGTDDAWGLQGGDIERLSAFPVTSSTDDAWATAAHPAATPEDVGGGWESVDWSGDAAPATAPLQREESAAPAGGEDRGLAGLWPRSDEPRAAPFSAYAETQAQVTSPPAGAWEPVPAMPEVAPVPPVPQPVAPPPVPEPVAATKVTAPQAAPQPAPPAPRDVVVGPAEKAVLETYLAAVQALPDVRHSAVVRRDGAAVAGTLHDGAVAEGGDLDAVLAATLASSARCTGFANLGGFDGLTIAGRDGMLLLVESGPLALLAVLTAKEAKLGPLRRTLHRQAASIKEALAASYVS